MRMIEIEKGRTYRDRAGHDRVAVKIGTDCRPPGYRQPGSGIEWHYAGDATNLRRSLLSNFASDCVFMVVQS